MYFCTVLSGLHKFKYKYKQFLSMYSKKLIKNLRRYPPKILKKVFVYIIKYISVF